MTGNAYMNQTVKKNLPISSLFVLGEKGHVLRNEFPKYIK
jgi:hypothetical protein